MDIKCLIHCNGGDPFGNRNFTKAVETILGSRPNTAKLEHVEGNTENGDCVVIQYKNKYEGAYVIGRAKDKNSGETLFAVKICTTKNIMEGNPKFHPWRYVAVNGTLAHYKRFLTAVDKVHFGLKTITEAETQLYKDLAKAK